MYLSPRATSELFSGLNRHTTLMVVSAAGSAMSAAVDGRSAASSRYRERRVTAGGEQEESRRPRPSHTGNSSCLSHTVLQESKNIFRPRTDFYYRKLVHLNLAAR